MKIAVFASGNGSNFQVLAETIQNSELPASIELLFCDQPAAFVLERASRLGIEKLQFSPKDFVNKSAYEQELLTCLREKEIDLILLAGYMRIIGPDLLSAYEKRIINIHPSLLPAFPGLHGIRDAYEAGVAETGVTVHYIDAGVDTGPIIRQKKVAILPEDTLASLEEKIHAAEHQIYPEVITEIITNWGHIK
ncbi:phosphoribosylglycinamide formyltransferase [Enterococcus faecalis 13-SD-W-01]|nr:phosphoribosylglycinamide formyltransferase [Enterococcus faecalis 13-SD-W-01]